MKIFEDAPEYDSKGYGEANPAINGEQLVMREFLYDGDVVFDVGANLGTWTEYALLRAKVRVHAFEPVSYTFEDLQRSIGGARASLHHCAVGARAGDRIIYAAKPRDGESKAASGASSFFPGCLKAHPVISLPQLVAVETLDNYCLVQKIDRIDFLKVDTEGAEHEVLCGAKRLFTARAIRRVQFEYGGCYKHAGTSLKLIYDLLTSYGFVLHRILPDSLLRITTWREPLEGFQYSNYLALLKG